MLIYFKTREQARQFKSGKLVDLGPSQKNGRRWAKDVSKKK